MEPVVLTWFFLSGLAALIYQVIWARELELVFGSTLYAVSTILSVFMAGLALGSIIFGRIADKHAVPLKLYGFLELGIGLYALLTPWSFRLLRVIQPGLPDFVRGSGSGFSMFGFIFSLIVLIIPTTFMGGTLPILSKSITGAYRELGSKIGMLYFINTLGAAIGAFLAGFVLIARFGMMTSTVTAATINIVIGGSALWIQRYYLRSRPPIDSSSISASKDQPSPPLHKNLGIVLLVGYGFAGFCALGLEVLWTRVLVLVMGSSVYAFSLMLTAILAGIAYGSTLGARIADRSRRLWVWFACIEMALGIAVIVITPFLGESPLLFLNFFLNYRYSFASLLVLEFIVVFLLLMVPTILMGAAFPIASKIYATDLKRLGNRIGNIYASNTVGAIVGPLAVSFVLIPLVSIQKSILILAYVYVAIGAAVLVGVYWSRRYLKAVPLLGLAAVVVAGSVLVPGWNELIITSGVYYHMGSYDDSSGQKSARELMTDKKLLFYKEGQLATVTVTEMGGQKVLTINGKIDASSSTDLGTQLLLAHLPLLLQRQPSKVLCVGLGSGITLGAILKHPEVTRVDMVEIEPAVVEAAGYFSSENGNALLDARTNMVVNDARNFIINTQEKYDVISAEPSNPWVSHSSTMFSREVFELYARIINEDGVVMQWFHLYRMGNEDLRMIINTFLSVFPHTTLWGKAGSPDIILIGSPKPLGIDFNEFDKRLHAEGVARDLARIDSADVFQMLNYFLMDEEALARYAGSYPVNTDDRPRLEFTAPRSLYAITVGTNLESMKGYRGDALAVLTGTDNPAVLAKVVTDYEARERAIQAEIYWENGEWDKAVGEWQASLAISPLYKLSQNRLSGYSEELEWNGERALEKKDIEEAFYYFTRASEVMPGKASIRINLGLAAMASKQPELAVIHFTEASKLAPTDASVYYYLGKAFSDLDQHMRAVENYTKAVIFDPASAAAYAGRAFSYSVLGLREQALADYGTTISLSNDADLVAVAQEGIARLQR